MKNLSILIALFTLFSCQNTSSVSEEMDKYCECIKNPMTEMKECIILRNDLVKKYEFDPEATEIIQMKLSECAQN